MSNDTDSTWLHMPPSFKKRILELGGNSDKKALAVKNALDTLQAEEKWKTQQIVRDAKDRAEIARWLGGREHRILMTSDFHIPYHNTEAIKWALDIGIREGCDVAIIGGDAADLAAVSQFISFSDSPLADELRVLKSSIDLYQELFKYIILINANHEERVAKFLAKALPKEVLAWLADEIGTLNLMKQMSRNRRNVRAANEWCRIGDFYASHKHEFMSIPMRSVSAVAEYFEIHYEDVYPAMIAHAHTHHCGAMYSRGKYLIETGCLSAYEDYALTGKAGPSKKEPWVNGCAVLTVDRNGKSVFSESQIYVLGEAKSRE